MNFAERRISSSLREAQIIIERMGGTITHNDTQCIWLTSPPAAEAFVKRWTKAIMPLLFKWTLQWGLLTFCSTNLWRHSAEQSFRRLVGHCRRWRRRRADQWVIVEQNLICSEHQPDAASSWGTRGTVSLKIASWELSNPTAKRHLHLGTQKSSRGEWPFAIAGPVLWQSTPWQMEFLY